MPPSTSLVASDDNGWLLPDVNLCEVVDITITATCIKAE